MNQIAQVQASAQQSLRAALGMANGQNAQGSDAFAMLLQQLFGNNGETSVGDLMGQLLGQNSSEGQDDENNLLGLEMAAELLANNPNFIPDAALFAENALLVNAAGGGSGKMSAQQLLTLLQQSQSVKAENPQTILQQENSVEILSVTNNSDNAQNENSSLMDFAFQNDNFRAAKELLQKNPIDEVLVPLDIDSLQADVDAGKFLNVDGVKQENQFLPMPSMEDIAAQVKEGISQNQDKNEFTIKLTPEGLGEIVVKLSEESDKISLSIFTSNSQVAKLISDEVRNLQNALRPYNAEVNNIVVAQEGTTPEDAAKDTLLNQDDENQQQRHWYQNQDNNDEDENFENVILQALLDEEKQIIF